MTSNFLLPKYELVSVSYGSHFLRSFNTFFTLRSVWTYLIIILYRQVIQAARVTFMSRGMSNPDTECNHNRATVNVTN